VRRYQRCIQRLNSIQKVCILSNMLITGLTRGSAGEVLAAGGVVRSLGSASAWRPEAMRDVLDSGSDYSVN
jgi:hypothetical protein